MWGMGHVPGDVMWSLGKPMLYQYLILHTFGHMSLCPTLVMYGLGIVSGAVRVFQVRVDETELHIVLYLPGPDESG